MSIVARSLSKSYGSVVAVDGIDLDVRSGSVFGFLGPNGAGKSTTIKMLTTLHRPTRGSIRIDGLDPATHPHEVRRRFGIVFQDPSLDIFLTAMENLELHAALYGMPRAGRRERIEVSPGASLSLQSHKRRSEHWVVVAGRARVTRGEETFDVARDESTFIRAGEKHRLENPGDEPLVVVEVQCGDYLGEDDIERFEDSYNRS